MITVGKLLEKKGKDVWQVTPDDTVYNAIKRMENKHVGALAVVDGGKLVGIVSERDYARKVILKNRTSKDTLVKEIMTNDVISVLPERTIGECLVMMNECRIRHLPIMQGDHLEGMISIGDVVKEIIREQKYTIQQLENNISWAESY
ncbi:MAG: CBS domain-containing protein [Gammaproteobacteria bacterium]|nr:CBS domain-containing protein [Gammaproteobacteria bacterium]